MLEERVAALEGVTAALAVASGHAAEFLTFHTLLQPGDEFIAANKLYGWVDQPVQPLLQKLRLECAVCRCGKPADFERLLSPRTKAIFIESIATIPAGHH